MRRTSHRLTWMLCIGVMSIGSLTLAQSSPSAQQGTAAKTDAQRSFGILKSLAGTWSGIVTTAPANPDLDGPIQVTMRVASGGSVLVHEIAPGGTPEPTMIYVDRGRLTLVHYCEAGNRPRLAARHAPRQGSIEFELVDISGSKSPAYLHDFAFSIVDADHHMEDWTFMLPGDKELHAHFDLKRAMESVRPANSQ